MKSYGQTLVLLMTALVMAACSHVPAEEGAQRPQRAVRGTGLPLAAGLAAERREAQETTKTQEAPKKEEPQQTAAAEEKKPETTEETKDDSPGFFARLFGLGKKNADTESGETAKTAAATEVQPTPAQQAAAHRMLDNGDTPTPFPGELTPGRDDTDSSPVSARNGLRLGRFAPPEEGTDAAEAPAPRPNKVELRGLRSPMLPGGKLPMDINGKLTPEDHD